MLTTIRWVVFLPLALLASMFAGGTANYFGELYGGSSWYGWLLSGAVSAWAFFYVAFRVAPSTSRTTKWICVAVLATIGALSAAGALVFGRNPISAIAGMVMVGVAVYYARRPTALVVEDATKPLF